MTSRLANAGLYLMDNCAVPDDGRWYDREVVMNGLLVAGSLRKIGVSQTQVVVHTIKPYEPRVILATVTDAVRTKDGIG